MNLVRDRGDRRSAGRVNVLKTGRKIQPDERPFNHGSNAEDFVEKR